MLQLTKNMGDIFKNMSFISEAVSKDDIRPVLTCIFVDEENIVATDSHRLHLWKDYYEKLNIEPGLYEIIKKTKSEIVLEKSKINGEYPGYKTILPDMESKDTLYTQITLIENSSGDKKLDLTRLAFSIYRFNIMLDIDFLKPIIELNFTTGYLKLEDQYTPVILKNNKGLTAFLMPLSYD